jgi:hypothetical protein
MSVRADVVYTLDASDAIVEVNEAWTAFAASNGGATLLSPAILGRSLWDFLADETTSLIYRRLFERVRAGAGPVRFGFRCDAPAVRRLLEMTITAQPGGALTLVVRALQLEDRPVMPLLDPGVKRSEILVRMCAWCKRIPDSSGRWMEIEEALPRLEIFQQQGLPAITHGICQDCQRLMTVAIEDAERAASGAITLGDWPPLDMHLPVNGSRTP